MESEQALRTSWNGLLEQLRTASEVVLGPTGGIEELDQAEGIRFVTRLASGAFDMIVEHGDTLRPEFLRLMTPHRKFYGDNPDTYYDYASINGGRRYVISGSRGTSEYMACCVYGWDKHGRTRIVANVADIDMSIEADGRFELHLSAEPPPTGTNGRWVPLSPDVDCVIMRQYFLNREVEDPAQFGIVCLEPVPDRGQLTVSSLVRRVDAAGAFVARGTEFSTAAAHLLAQQPNELGFDSEVTGAGTFYPTPDNKYLGGWYRLGPEEALIVEGHPPRSRYWSVLLMSRWMESLDTQHHQSALNKRQIVLESDGSFRVVVAHRDPGVPNWLDTAGHGSGYVMFRWMQATEVDRPIFRVACLGELA